MRLKSQEYTIGWICALSEELVAARAMLDEHHEVPRLHKSDRNMYCCGRMEGHNIVITCLPTGAYGTTSAATVAAQMLSTFESIRFGLMVGIGGGVPSKGYDIRLGDVVVSKPSGTFGGVVQYDIGKNIEGGPFMRTGSLNKPPQILLNAVAGLKAEHMLEGSKIPLIHSRMVENHPNMLEGFSYQHELDDWLFVAGYKHEGGDTCETCDRSKVVERPNRRTTDPLIHYGVIASGNQVMKNSDIRDQLKKELDIICFEMEAAGLMDNFPCLVIRGICDYADTHKNKGWQMYAAATAAAYAKELLCIIPAHQVEATLRAAEVMGTS
jgi:nucleoside phosphorylase